MKSYSSVDSYIKDQTKEVQTHLRALRAEIKKIAPKGTVERIAYGIPTYTTTRNVLHFGGFAKHVSLFPGSIGVAAFKKELTRYKTARGTIQFPLDTPLPMPLIRKIVRYCFAAEAARAKANAKKRKTV